MSDLSSAGTLVAAVLQTSGLAAQQNLLNNFSAFFESLGALLYVISGIGAVVSVAIFGNYRMARYLFVGPVVFWFLVVPRTPHQGIEWRIGDGQSRVIEGVTDSATSAGRSRAVVAGANYDTDGDEVPDAYEVAWFFAWFTSIIDNFVNNSVGFILQYEDDEDLDFISRTRAMDMLGRAQVDNQEISRMLMGTFPINCKRMLGASYALGHPNLDTGRLDDLIGTDSNTGELGSLKLSGIRDLINGTRDSYETQLERARVGETFNIDIATLNYMRSNPNALEVRAFLTENNIPGGDPANIRKGHPMKCGDMWDLLTEAIMLNAADFNDKLFHEYAAATDDESQDRLCRALASKLASSTYPDLYIQEEEDPPPCDLVAITTMYMMRNALTSASAYTNRVQEIKNRMQLTATTKPEESVQAISPYRDELKVVGSVNRLQTRQNERSGQVEVLFQREGCAADPECLGQEYEWHPIMVLGKVGGHADTSFGEHQAYLSRGLRQRIFHYSLQLPYYQGMLLYFISIAYPFMALFVIMPSHAYVFLYLPLAWLWVKSWDVGYALVMVLEKVLWNMLPETDLPIGFNRGEGIEGPPIPDVLKETMAIDPTFNVHAYYFMIGTVMFAIPNITGYAILKAKANALASFTEGPEKLAQGVQDRAESSYGIARITEKQDGINARRNLNQLANSTMMQFNAWQSNNQGSSSEQWAKSFNRFMPNLAGSASRAAALTGLSVAPGLAADVAKGKFLNKGGPRQLLNSLGATGDKGVSRWLKMQSIDANFRSSYDGMFNRFEGSQGIYARRLRGSIAAEEAQSFGFEAGDNQAAFEMFTTTVDTAKAKFDVLKESFYDAAKGIGGNITTNSPGLLRELSQIGSGIYLGNIAFDENFQLGDPRDIDAINKDVLQQAQFNQAQTLANRELYRQYNNSPKDEILKKSVTDLDLAGGYGAEEPFSNGTPMKGKIRKKEGPK